MTLRILFFGILFISSFSANAALNTVDNGFGVYDNILNVTWTSDANLLATMEANPSSYGYQNTSSLIDAIIAFTPIVYDTPNYYDGSNNNYGSNSGSYVLSSSDFYTNGVVNWFSAQAFVNFLNQTDYGSSTNWVLPTADPSCNLGFNCITNQLGELFYSELGGKAFNPIPTNSLFTNEAANHWINSGQSGSSEAWYFDGNNGEQYAWAKNGGFVVWATSPGQLVAPVPLPPSIWLFGTTLLGFLDLKRRKH